MTPYYFIHPPRATAAMLFATVLLFGCAASSAAIKEPAPPASESNQIAQAPAPRASRLRPQSLKTEMFKRQQRYDRGLRTRVNERWSGLLDATSLPVPSGAVTIGFRLFQDGHVSNLEVINTTVDDQFTTLCKRAVLDSAPFDPYPSPGSATNSYREIRFDFKFE